EALRRAVHDGGVEFRGDVPAIAQVEWTGDPAVVDDITIPLGGGVQGGMERLGHLLCLEDAHIAGHQDVEGPHDRLRRVSRGGKEVDHLAEGMDAGVGPAAGRGGRAGAGQLVEGVLDDVLHRPEPRLPLPAAELGPIVAERQLDIPHRNAARRRPAVTQASTADRSSSVSAIWTALVAAPFRRLSLTHQKSRVLGRLKSGRIRPTKTSSLPAASAAKG